MIPWNVAGEHGGAGIVRGIAHVFVVSVAVAEAADCEGFAAVGVVVGGLAPPTMVGVRAGAISPGIFELGATFLHLVVCQEVGRRGVVKDARGYPRVCVGLGQGYGQEVLLASDVSYLLPQLSHVSGYAAKAVVGPSIPVYLHSEGHVFLLGNRKVHQLGEWLVGRE
jgi:hypothetical protein